MTQNELARLTGLTQGFISLVLSGDRTPRYEVAKIIAEHTHTRPELWLEGRSSAKRKALRRARAKSELTVR